MQLIPQALVPAVQAYLAGQGQNPNIIAPDGSLDAAGLIGLAYNQVEVRTTLTPSLIFPIAPGGQQQGGAMEALVHQLQPTIIFSGPAGRQEIAPYGETAGAESWLPAIAIGGVVVLGIGWLIFGK